MTKSIFPSPALIILIVCGIAISYASQRQDQFDPNWIAVCALLFAAGCVVSFNITRQPPVAPVRIVMTRATWQRAKQGLVLGALCFPCAFAWLVWALKAFPARDMASMTVIVGPALALGGIGVFLIYYWLGLWAFGTMQDEPMQDEPSKLPDEPQD